MSEAFAGVGAKFKRSNMLGTPTFTAIAEVNDISGPNITADTIDTTSLDTTGGYRTFITGFLNAGEVQLTMNFTPSGFDDLLADIQAREIRDYQIVLPDTGETTLGFSALPSALGMKVAAADKVTATATFKISGEVTLTS